MTKSECIDYGNDYLKDLLGACCKISEKHLEFVKQSISALEENEKLRSGYSAMKSQLTESWNENERLKAKLEKRLSDQLDNKEKFEEAEKKIKEIYPGTEVINPARVNEELPESTTWEEYMEMCYVMINMADKLYMLDQWRESVGACVEYGYALAKGKEIIMEDGRWKA